jgi:hypothetical protein
VTGSAVEVPRAECAGRDTARAGLSWLGLAMICRRGVVSVHGDGGVAAARCRGQPEASGDALCARTGDESDVLSVLRVRDG